MGQTALGDRVHGAHESEVIGLVEVVLALEQGLEPWKAGAPRLPGTFDVEAVRRQEEQPGEDHRHEAEHHVGDAALPGLLADDGIEEVRDGLRAEAEGAGLDDPADGGEHCQHHHRDQHHRRRLVRVLHGALGRGLAGEGHPPHPARVEAGDQRGDKADAPDDQRERVVRFRESGAQDLLLGEEADEGDHAHEREGADQERPGRAGKLTEEAAVLAHVLLVMHGVDDVARGHEEEGLEEGVSHEVEEGGRVGANSDRQEHVPDLAHGRVGEHPLDVGLHDGDGGCEQRGDRADDRDGCVGVNGDVVDGVHAADEVDAGRDHRGRVDQGTYRSRSFHCVRQPGVQWKLRGFGDGAHQQQERGELKTRAVMYRANVSAKVSGQAWGARETLKDLRKRDGVVGGEQDERAQDHADVADHVHHERFACGKHG